MLRVAKLSSFYGKVQAVWEVSFEVAAGEVVAIIGSNGAGKTTILQSVVGLVEKRGEVVFEGREISRVPAHEMAGLGIAYVPEGRMVFPEMSVAENLIVGNRNRRARPERRDLMSYVLDTFPRLKERLHNYAGTLSGGEQQMLAIGRGLMAKPKLMLLDEPSLGIAPLLTEEIFAQIDKLRQSIAIVLVEQHVHHALAVCDRAYVIETGRVALAGPGEQLRSDPHVQAVYLGV